MPENSASNVDIDEPQDVSLSLSTTAAPDELWDRWQWLRELADKAGEQTTETGKRWKDTTDPTVRDRLWVEYEAQTREYRVLAAWKELFYTAFIFSTDGADCAALGDIPHRD